MVEHSKKLVAEDWYDMKILERTFSIWNCITVQNKLIMENKIRQAEAHYAWYLPYAFETISVETHTQIIALSGIGISSGGYWIIGVDYKLFCELKGKRRADANAGGRKFGNYCQITLQIQIIDAQKKYIYF